MSRTSFIGRLVALVRRLRPQIRRHRRLLIKGTAGTLLVVACRLAFPWPLRGILETAFGSERSDGVTGILPEGADPMLWFGAMFMAIVVTQGFAEILQRLSFARFSIELVREVRVQALAGIADGRKSKRRDPGDLIARVIGDSARFKSGLKSVLIRMTQNGTFVLGVCAMLLVIDTLLGVVFVVGTTLILIVAGVGAGRVDEVSRRLRRKEGDLAGRMHAALAGTKADLATVEDDERRESRAEAKTTRMEGLTMLGVHALLGLTTCAVLALGLHAVDTGRLQAGDLFTVLFYLVLVHNPAVRLGRQAVRVGKVLTSAERLVKLTPKTPAAEREKVAA